MQKEFQCCSHCFILCFCAPGFVVPTVGDVPDFPMDMTFLPPLGFPNLEEPCSPPFDSDISDSCPASPSPVSSPSPHCSSSSSESGIEDVSDMEDTTTIFRQTPGGSGFLKKENPSSPLNSLNQVSEPSIATKRRRKSSRKTSKDSSVVEELKKLLVETSMSAAFTSTDPSFSLPSQTQASMTSLDMMTKASPTFVSESCPLSVQPSQAMTLAQTLPIVTSTQLTSSATATNISNSPPAVSQSKIKSKSTKNAKKSDEPKIVIIEEPEEVRQSCLQHPRS